MTKKNPNEEELADLDEGDEVTAFWGEEKFAPIQYHLFAVGPFLAKTKVREGETGNQAFRRAYQACRIIARASYLDKRDEFIKNVHDAADKVHESARKNR